MKKKGAELISIFLISMLLFCSVSFTVQAATNEWGYNDSYVNSASTENKRLIFFPIAPASQYSDYMILYWHGNYYMILGNGDFLIYGNGGIQYPSPSVPYIYESDSNSWVQTQYPNTIAGTSMPSFDRSLTVIDATSNVRWWGVGTPIQEYGFTNYSGYRIYWNLALILIQILTWVTNISNYILSVHIIRYLCLTALAGEFLVFAVLLLRKIGALKNEKSNL